MTGDKMLDSLLLVLNEKATVKEGKFKIYLLEHFPDNKESVLYEIQYTNQLQLYEVYLTLQLCAFTGKKPKDVIKMYKHFREYNLGWESTYKRMARIYSTSTEYSIMKTRVQRMIERLS